MADSLRIICHLFIIRIIHIKCTQGIKGQKHSNFGFYYIKTLEFTSYKLWILLDSGLTLFCKYLLLFRVQFDILIM